jgi:NAD(P)-dependent dehydrogenase (short-subunit alcohol dehydrogenase family)
MLRFEGKVAIVAGGGRGIGAETAMRLAAEGAAVVVGDLIGANAVETGRAIEEHGGRALGLEVDIADEASVSDLIAATLSKFGRLDVLDNNAANTSPEAMVGDTDVVAIDMDLWDRIFAVNIRGFVLTSRHAIPAMLETGGGAIVNIASGSGLSGEPDHVAYGCSKAAAIQLARHIAVRWGKEGIRANAIAPGLIVSNPDMMSNEIFGHFADLIRLRVLTPDLGHPRDIAGTVAFLLSDDAAYLTGQVIQVDGGMFLRGGTGRAEEPISSEGLAQRQEQS